MFGLNSEICRQFPVNVCGLPECDKIPNRIPNAKCRTRTFFHAMLQPRTLSKNILIQEIFLSSFLRQNDLQMNYFVSMEIWSAANI